MKYPLYHRVHREMTGNTLYPLNVLKSKYPELYEKYIKKYKNRPHVLEQKIPILDCLWNDVVHLSSIHPMEIKQALASIGIEYSGKFFVIDAENLDQGKLVIWLNTKDSLKGEKGATSLEYFERFNLQKYDTFYKIFPKERQIKAWQTWIQENQTPPLVLSKCPHFLYKGEIPLDGVKIINI